MADSDLTLQTINTSITLPLTMPNEVAIKVIEFVCLTWLTEFFSVEEVNCYKGRSRKIQARFFFNASGFKDRKRLPLGFYVHFWGRPFLLDIKKRGACIGAYLSSAAKSNASAGLFCFARISNFRSFFVQSLSSRNDHLKYQYGKAERFLRNKCEGAHFFF